MKHPTTFSRLVWIRHDQISDGMFFYDVYQIIDEPEVSEDPTFAPT